MSKFGTKELIYEIRKLTKENTKLIEKLRELEDKCDFCTKPCGQEHCVTKEEGK